jgi:ssDNA-binding Zn-finger/Zn-ribbon topoisomerase 1
MAEQLDLLSPAGVPMVKRTGRFGDFLFEDKPRPVKPKGKKAAELPTEPPPFILNLDRKGGLKFPSPPPVVTDIPCPKCGDVMNLRDGKRGPWLGCRAFPKCRGREAFAKLPDDRRKALEIALEEHMRGQTKLSLTEAQLGAEVEVRRAFSQWQQATELADASQKVVEQAEEAVRLANARYNAGTATQLDVLSAQVDLTTARTNQLQAYYGYNVAVASLRKAMGQGDEFLTAAP